MSEINIHLDQDGSGEAFKRQLDRGEKPITSISLLTRKLPDGKAAVLLLAGRTRILISARNFLEAAAAIKAAHPQADDRANPELPSGSMIGGEHRGHQGQAIHMEHVYIVSSAAAPGKISITGDEATAEVLGKATIDRALPPCG